MTNKNIKYQLDHLPLLPDIVQDFRFLKRNHPQDFDKYITLINRDSIGCSKVLKVVNSKPFCFDHYIDTPTKAINLLGINFTHAVLLYEHIKNSFNNDLYAYGSNILEFDLITLYSTKVALKWIDSTTCNDREKLILPMLINDIGKFVISSVLRKEKKSDHFYDLVNSSVNIPSIEKSVLGATASEISAYIFKTWKFNNGLVKTIFYMDNPLDAKENQKVIMQLHAIKTIFNINSPMDKSCINLAFEKLKGLDFNLKKLRTILEEIENDFLSAYQKIRK